MLDDRVLPFQVDALDSRGRIVRLGPMLDTILMRHAYPAAVSRALGEAAALTVLLGTSLKFEGRFILQTKTDGPIRMLVVDFEAPDRLRACAMFDADRVAASDPSTPALLGSGILAMTVDQGADFARHQGIVQLSGQGLEAAAHEYFRQSEQIPTRIRLAVGESVTDKGHGWRAGGLLVQFLPQSVDRLRAADLPPGDAPEGSDILVAEEDQAWVEARVLTDTIEDHELLDPMVTSEALLYRLFHEQGVRVFDPQPVVERCRCSRDSVETMLRGFAPGERNDMVADDGSIEVTCEFCSTRYRFQPSHFDAPKVEA